MTMRVRLVVGTALVPIASLAFGAVGVYWHAVRMIGTEIHAAIAVGRRMVEGALIELTQTPNPQRRLQALIASFDGDRHMRVSLVDSGNATVVASSPDGVVACCAALVPPPEVIRFELPAPADVLGTILLETNARNEICEVWSDTILSVSILAGFCGIVLGLVSWQVARSRPARSAVRGVHADRPWQLRSPDRRSLRDSVRAVPPRMPGQYGGELAGRAVVSMKILIVDDHVLIREGVRRLVTSLPEVCLFETASGREALTLYKNERPDLVLLDLNLANSSGLELLRRLLLEDKAARVLILSIHTEPIIVARTLRAGAKGYISKTAAIDELLTAIQEVARGQRYIEREIATQLLFTSAADDPLQQLTSREVDIVRLLGQGKSLAAIAELLGVANKTVANACTGIKTKLGLERTADLVRLALEMRNT